MSCKKYILCWVVGIAIIFFWGLLPIIPMHTGLHKYLMEISVLHSSWFSALSIAESVACSEYFYSELNTADEVARYWNEKEPFNYHGVRQAFVEVETLGDLGWPEVISRVKIKYVYYHDDSRNLTYNINMLSTCCPYSSPKEPTDCPCEKT